MYKYHNIFLFMALIIVLGVAGCSQSNRPEGLPKLYSCQITITQDGKPLPEASIQFIGGESAKWPISGLTDASGIAKMVTYGQFPGVPAGDYHVVVQKTVENVLTVGSDYSSGSSDIYSLVEVKFTKAEETDLEISVSTGRNSQTFEVGKEVRVLVDSIRPGT